MTIRITQGVEKLRAGYVADRAYHPLGLQRNPYVKAVSKCKILTGTSNTAVFLPDTGFSQYSCLYRVFLVMTIKRTQGCEVN